MLSVLAYPPVVDVNLLPIGLSAIDCLRYMGSSWNPILNDGTWT